ncbi:MAG: asparagine synthase, partial [Bacteroidetes bacterium]|nr:asparagine synthase [Bacteroidota bacterium]
SKYASLIAEKFGARHTTIKLAPETMLQELIPALNVMDTPSADGINTYVVSKAVSQSGMRVALTGTGGDELFAGYPFFLQYTRLHNKKNWYKGTGLLRKIIAGGLTGATSSRRQRLQQIIQAPSPAIEYNYPISRQILPPALIRKFTAYKDFSMQDTALYKQLVSHSSDIAGHPLLSQVSLADYLGYTQHTLLKDTDQMSMAVSLEVREPFFDQDLVEFMLRVPDSQKFPDYPKRLMVEALKPMLPDEIVHRKKQGFVFPWKNWMKEELRSFCEERLNAIGKRSFINAKELQVYWQRFLNGDLNVRWTELWLFVVLEYWMERNGIEE